jgi:T-lymphoma invasion and metastasis-inducing protein 1
VVSDALGRAQIESQIAQWDDNLERLHCEQFRLRCYMASLQNGELPNPKVILSLVLLIMKLSLPAYSRYTCSHCVVVWSL